MSDEFVDEIGDPSVPTDLLEIHVALEQAQMTPEQFKETFNGEPDSES